MPSDVDHFPFSVSRETNRRLERHLELLRQWQKTHNLVAASTLNELWPRHVKDSARLWPLISSSCKSGSLVDLGSGAGFPGIVLAAIAKETGRESQWPIHLIESNGKKAAFLRHVVRSLDLNATVHQDRIETIAPQLADENVTVVTARALAPLDKLLALAAPLLIAGATGIFPKGRRFEVEVEAAKRYWKFDLQVCDPRAVAPDKTGTDDVEPADGPVLVVGNVASRQSTVDLVRNEGSS
ncbi:MAG: 16S rRNA (guanine(527)-N(7))-methyltransferase RsmG [Pseudomonadota bacterium]